MLCAGAVALAGSVGSVSPLLGRASASPVRMPAYLTSADVESGPSTVAVEGPGNSLWVYWEDSSAQWQGPLGVGAPGSTFSSPSLGFDASGLPTVAVQGPGNSLWVYWEDSSAQWQGPLGVGAPGSTFSSPSLALSESGPTTVAVQGPGNSLWVYWEDSDAQWQGPLGVGGPGSTFSSPSLAMGASGPPTVAVQGPGNSLWVYWEDSDAQWQGPLGVGGPGSTFSSPSLTLGANGPPTVAVQGPGDSLWVYWEDSSAQWQGPLGAGAPGSTFSSPSLTLSANEPPTVAAQGPDNSLWVYWEDSSAQWQGPLGAGAPGSTFSSPSLAAGLTSSQSSSGPALVLPPLALGATGPSVLTLQDRLTALGYWLGTPDGTFGDSTQQALYALQKAAQIPTTGTVTPATLSALNEGVVPAPRSTSGYVIEVDLADDLLMVVDNGGLEYTLNTSTGGGYTYTDDGVTSVAITPTGQFQIYRQVNGLVVDSLGALWRPKFFDAGFAIHGDSYVPPVPVSHGCVRVSDEAIDWIWSSGIIPLGTTVWVY